MVESKYNKKYKFIYFLSFSNSVLLTFQSGFSNFFSMFLFVFIITVLGL